MMKAADSISIKAGAVKRQIIIFGLGAAVWLTQAAGQTSDGYTSPASISGSNGGGASILINPSPFQGSVTEGQAKPETIALTFKDAIDKGLRNNLGLLVQADNQVAARGQKWKELSDLLPNLNLSAGENVARINLATLGLRFSIPGFPTVVGPFGYFDSRFYLTQPVLDLKALNRTRGASEGERAALYNYKDAREFVVLAVGNAYLEAIAGEARVTAAEAQVETAQALYDKTADQQKAGTSPAIDTLRSKVELQSRQQQLIVARNDFAKQKLALARAIGLPVAQEFSLADKAPYQALVPMGLEENLQRAYASRPDYLAAAAQVRAAERFRKAASAEYLPTLGITANYGASGVTMGGSHGSEAVYQVTGGLNIPIFQGGKTHSDVLQAEATLRQSRQQLENLRGQIEYEIRSDLLDLAAANDQVEVAKSSVELANETLAQARDRFAAGVTDNLEVVQAQESVATANEDYISALYAHNFAKIALARAVGIAEEGVQRYLNSK